MSEVIALHLETSQKIEEIAAALTKAQGMIDHRNWNDINQSLSFSNLWEICSIPLSENGITVIQIPAGIEVLEKISTRRNTKNNKLQKSTESTTEEELFMKSVLCQVLVCRMIHESGQWIQATVKMPIDHLTTQEINLALAYIRWYSLEAMVGIA
ncbi:hypothetical protein SPFL3102_01499 [Sporomusaceae bacterium FL31]|nr:hypothetical protein SPFL3101_03132 [Sporomusaceae bacterium FL31]GCE33691.1 hypothetical protein SPFL3102_01499 [Sporomusaceae bacterium]